MKNNDAQLTFRMYDLSVGVLCLWICLQMGPYSVDGFTRTGYAQGRQYSLFSRFGMSHPYRTYNNHYNYQQNTQMINKWIYYNDGILPKEATIFTTGTMPDDPRLFPTVGNGHIATAVYSDTIYMNGFYNGYAYESHRARIPSPCAIKIRDVSEKVIQNEYALNLEQGVFMRVMVGKNFQIVQRIYAHRKLEEVMVVEMEIVHNLSRSLHLSLDMNLTDSTDLKGTYEPGKMARMPNATYYHGTNTEPEEYDVKLSQIHILFTDVPSLITIRTSQSYKKMFFFTAIGRTRQKVVEAYHKAKVWSERQTLFAHHKSAWEALWKQGYIDIKGDLNLAQVTYAAQYYLYSSLPTREKTKWPGFVGLSPGGLAHGTVKDYGGHVFWDQDTWMYPSILLLHADLGKVLMLSRTRTLDAAKARAVMKGYKGAMYPWESAYSGMETTNDVNVANYEHHVTGDVAYALEQYLYMTQDLDFLKYERGAELVEAIADFWVSRVVRDDKTNKYVIRDVMGPDEYHYPVNNSVYTNFIAVKNLKLAEYCNNLLGVHFNKTLLYKLVAHNIYIPFDTQQQYHPEFDNYTNGTTVKQADVILLGFPLMMEMSETVRRNDLTRYGLVSDHNGPAMTWAMFAIGWLEMKELKIANHYFAKNFKNVLQPFKMWSEYSDGSGAVNFLTGMGGFLQGLLFGYAGFRIHSNQLEFDPVLPLNSTQVTLNNLDYLGNSFTLTYNNNHMSITLMEQGKFQLGIKLFRVRKVMPLELRKTLYLTTQRAAILSIDSRSVSTRIKRSINSVSKSSAISFHQRNSLANVLLFVFVLLSAASYIL